MPDERVLPSSQSMDLPTFTISSEGTELAKTVNVISIVVNKTVNRIPLTRIILKDGDAATGEFSLSNEDVLIPGKEIEVAAGYHNDNETIFKGIVVKHNIQIKGDNNSYLTIECKDISYRMSIGRKNKYFVDMSDSDAIEEIIQEYGFDKEVEASEVVHRELVQYNTSDWDFMVSRSDMNGKVVLIDDGRVKVLKPDFSSDIAVKLTFGATILGIDVTLDATHQHSELACRAWDQANQEIIESEALAPDVEEAGNMSSDELAGVVSDESMRYQHTGNLSSDELQAWANARKSKNVLSKIRGVVKCKGLPQIKPGNIIELEGIGDRFNGKVYVAGVRHELCDGFWEMDIQIGLQPKLFSAEFDMTETAAAGLLAAVNGLQLGVVSQLQDDPGGEDRVLVKMPVVDPDAEGTWARVASLDAGENRGAFFRPEIDDEVVLGFLNDDPRDPVILGMLNSSNKPAPVVASDDNHEKGFYTRDELKLVFNDELKSIVLETPNGNVAKLTDDEGLILIEDENGNKIQMNSDGINIESPGDISIKASGDVNIEGININLKASAALKGEGGASAEISSGGSTTIKGSIVSIN